MFIEQRAAWHLNGIRGCYSERTLLKRNWKLKPCQLLEANKSAPFCLIIFPSVYPFWVFEAFFTECYKQSSEGKVLLTLVHLVVHPMVKLIALLGVSQRLQASQNILGKKKSLSLKWSFSLVTLCCLICEITWLTLLQRQLQPEFAIPQEVIKSITEIISLLCTWPLG